MSVFQEASIKHKLVVLCVLILVALASVIATTIYQLIQIRDELVTVAEENIPMTQMVTDITVKQLEQSVAFERALHHGLKYDSSHSGEAFGNARNRFYALDNDVNQQLKSALAFIKQMEEHAITPEDLNKLINFEKQIRQIDDNHHIYAKHVAEVFAALKDRNSALAETLTFDIEKEEDSFNQATEHLLKELGEYSAASALRAEHHEEAAMQQVLIISSLAVIAIIGMCVMISRSIVKRIDHVRITMSDIAQNLDLTKRVDIKSKTEIGALSTDLDKLLGTLLGSITEVVNASSQLAAASEELSTISVMNSESVKQQYSATDQVAGAIQRLTDTSSDVAEISSQASDAARSAEKATHNGLEVVSENLNAMRDLENRVEQATQVITQLNKNSHDIASMLDVIQSVAEKTNLLALNAAIEAARAGEAGRGFAIVADQVRQLATQTHGSTAEIRELIDTLQSGSAKAVAIMDESQKQARDVAGKAEVANAALDQIAEAVNAITDFNQRIAVSASEQRVVAEEINENVSMIRASAQENAETTEQTTVSSEELSVLASDLQTTGAQFRI